MKRNLAWFGPLLTVLGFVSYFLYFSRFPTLRDFPWVNLPAVVAGAALSALGTAAVFSAGAANWKKGLAVAGLALSLGLGAYYPWYLFVTTADLPGEEGVVRVNQEAPSFRLLDQHGLPVALTDYRGYNVVLVFYRGHW